VHAVVVNKLVAARCKLDLQVNIGSLECATPLHCAAQEGHAAVTKQLLAARCNVHLQDKDGHTALEVAKLKGQSEVATLMML
jgi:ankyrin repeat protein